jgi:hypothetical protein
MKAHATANVIVTVILGIMAGCTRPGPTPPAASTPSIEAPKPKDNSDDPVVKEARSDTEAVLNDLLAGKLDNDPNLAPLARKLKGYRVWSIDRQSIERDNPQTVKFNGTLKGPQGEATFLATMVKQQNGKWMIGHFQGPDPK